LSSQVEARPYSPDDVAYVSSVFPEVEQISDAELRARVIEIWIDCWRESTWERIEDAPKNPKNLSLDRTLSQHVRGVTQQAIATAEIVERLHGITTNRDTLIASALLHDVSKLVEYQPDATGKPEVSSLGGLIQHAAYGAHLAWEKGLADEIVHVIISHTRNSRKPPHTLEGVIVHYVDYLDTDALLFDGKQTLDLHKHW
jgi:putative nucleotidyltransferase with HDIG domain